MNRKISANSNIMQRISPNDELARDCKPTQVYKNPRSAKPKFTPASFSILSDILRRDNSNPKPPAAGSFVTTKPLKLDARVLPISELSCEASGSYRRDDQVDDHMDKDMEDFLLKMLGDGFQLDRDMISKVLRSCGYDLPKSVEKLIDLSNAALDDKSNSHEKSFEKIFGQSEVPQWEKDSKGLNHSGCKCSKVDGVSSIDEWELATQEMEKVNLQREVASALFTLPEKDESESVDPYDGRKYKPIREVVYGPVKVSTVGDKRQETKPKPNTNVVASQDEEDGYQLLRKAVTEYRDTMREYYKAAVEAYSKGDQTRANKLVEKGKFFYRKAREADEESTRKIYQIRNVDAIDQDIIPLDLSELGAREALQLLKFHLKTLGGGLSFKYMKVTIEGPGEDVSKGARRRMIMKLMNKESINWVEGGDLGTILIPLEEIDVNSFTSVKK